MKIGIMNNPYGNIYDELEWIGKNGFDFVDFSVEPANCLPDMIDVARAKAIMKKYELGIVGHMGDWRLPKDSDYKSLRDASREEIIRAMRTLKKLGAKKFTFHSPKISIRKFNQSKKYHLQLIGDIVREAKRLNITPMMENVPSVFSDKNHTKIFEDALKKFPALKVHIDVGHVNLSKDRHVFEKTVKKHGKRITHLHFADNKGKDDDHRELGWGTVNWKNVVKVLKKHNYESTITLETFRSGRPGYLRSRKKLQKLWNT